MFTDIHWGAHTNSEQHNQDCINFIDWFCTQVKADPDIDHVIFLGDWHENRSALNVSTIKYSFDGAKMLDELGIPIFFIIGNHDLYYRHTRDVHSVFHFSALKNINIITEPTVCNDTYKPVLLCPYMFHHEYPSLVRYTKLPVWFGHFEFQGFVVTGYNNVMQFGPNAVDFEGPEHIFSGHFHKRQSYGNVTYIGNAFPTNFGDAGDSNRGMTVYDYVNNEVDLINWDACPMYIKTYISTLVDKKIDIPEGARVKCIADIPLTYEEINVVRQTFIDAYKLRELTIEDSDEIANVLCGTEVDVSSDELVSVNDMMMQLLSSIDTEHIDSTLLISIYGQLKTN